MLYLLQPTFVQASLHDICPRLKGNTIVFGGLGSTTSDMQQCYPEFLALSHTDGSRYVTCIADEINANKDKKFVIAGHSSGAEDAERVVRLVRDKTHVHLVLLEGYAYQRSQRGPVKTSCWYSENTRRKIQGFNAPSMLNPNVCPQPAMSFDADWCDTPLCLHLANVNVNTPHDLSKATILKEGLANCSGNMAWVKENKDWLKE